MMKDGQKIQTSNYKMNKPWGYNMQHGDYSQQYRIAYLEVSKRIDLKSPHLKKKNL